MDYKDRNGLQFINFDFVTGGQQIKVAIPVEFQVFLVVILSSGFSSYFFAFITFGDFFLSILR